MRFRIFVATFVLALARADWSSAEPEPQRPKIGVVFGGGGARGGAHVGVLKFLEELRIPIDFIAGTSIGAIVGGLYATGLSPQEMEDILRHTDWSDALTDDPPRKDVWYRRKEDDFLGYQLRASLRLSNSRMVLAKGFLAGEKLGIQLRWFTLPFSDETLDFDTLPIPYRCVATDLATGAKRVLRHGDLARSMRASMAIPAYFTPVAVMTDQARRNEPNRPEDLIDGGLVDNLPVDVVREMGAQVVIAVGIRTPPQEVTSIFGVINRLTSVLTDNELSAEGLSDVLIRPDLGAIDAFNFDQLPESIQPGYEEARRHLQALSAFTVSPEEYEQFLRRQRRRAEQKQPPTADHWDLTPVGRDGTPDTTTSMDANLRFMKTRLSTLRGQVRKEQLTRTLADVHQFNDFSSVDFRIKQTDGTSALIVEPPATYEAPTRVRLGLLLDSDFSGNSEFALRGNLNQTHVSVFGGEWKTRFEIGGSNSLSTQLYQPLEAGRRLFVMGGAGIKRQPFNFYVDDIALGQYVLSTAQVGLQAGISFGALGQLASGIQHDWYKAEEMVSPGQSRFPFSTTTQDATSFVARLDFDQIDNPNFPRSGWAARIHLMSSRGALSTDEPRETVTVGADWAMSSWRSAQRGCLEASSWMVPECDPDRRGRVGVGNWTVMLSANGMAQTEGRNPPVVESGFLGGFLNLSGLKPHQIWGRYTAIGRAIVHRRLFALPPVLGTDAHLGASLEAGNAWMNSHDVRLSSLRKAASVFLAAETRLGMVSLSYGVTDGRHHSVLFVLGLPFGPHRSFDSGLLR